MPGSLDALITVASTQSRASSMHASYVDFSADNYPDRAKDGLQEATRSLTQIELPHPAPMLAGDGPSTDPQLYPMAPSPVEPECLISTHGRQMQQIFEDLQSSTTKDINIELFAPRDWMALKVSSASSESGEAGSVRGSTSYSLTPVIGAQGDGTFIAGLWRREGGAIHKTKERGFFARQEGPFETLPDARRSACRQAAENQNCIDMRVYEHIGPLQGGLAWSRPFTHAESPDPQDKNQAKLLSVIALNGQGYFQRGEMSRHPFASTDDIVFVDGPMYRTLADAECAKHPYSHDQLGYSFDQSGKDQNTDHKADMVRGEIARSGVCNYAMTRGISYVDALRDGLLAGAIAIKDPTTLMAFHVDLSQQTDPMTKTSVAPSYLVKEALRNTRTLHDAGIVDARAEIMQMTAFRRSLETTNGTPGILTSISSTFERMAAEAKSEGMPELCRDYAGAAGALGAHARPSPEAVMALARRSLGGRYETLAR